MNIFKKNGYPECTIKESLCSKLETVKKSLTLLFFPAPFVVLISLFWYYFLYKNNIHFNDNLDYVVITILVSFFGLLYSLLAQSIISAVWNEYKAMRLAVKKYDFETFINLRDEEMSPLMHVLMLILFVFILSVFMGFQYPNIISGIIIISATSYLFLLMFFVVREIDDPCSGTWIIKSIPPEWLLIDAKEWRKEHIKKEREQFKEKLINK